MFRVSLTFNHKSQLQKKKRNPPKTRKQANNKTLTATTMKKVAETSKGLGYIFKFCNEFLAVLVQEDESRTFVTIDRKTA